MALTIAHDAATDGVDPGSVGRPGGAFIGHASGPGIVIKSVNIAWDASYAAGGEDLTPADVGLGEIIAVLPVRTETQSAFGDVDGGVSFKYDIANSKLIAYVTNGVEASGDITADADGTFWVIGRL